MRAKNMTGSKKYALKIPIEPEFNPPTKIAAKEIARINIISKPKG